MLAENGVVGDRQIKLISSPNPGYSPTWDSVTRERGRDAISAKNNWRFEQKILLFIVSISRGLIFCQNTHVVSFFDAQNAYFSTYLEPFNSAEEYSSLPEQVAMIINLNLFNLTERMSTRFSPALNHSLRGQCPGHMITVDQSEVSTQPFSYPGYHKAFSF